MRPETGIRNTETGRKAEGIGHGGMCKYANFLCVSFFNSVLLCVTKELTQRRTEDNRGPQRIFANCGTCSIQGLKAMEPLNRAAVQLSGLIDS
jgi:hypothetical protein